MHGTTLDVSQLEVAFVAGVDDAGRPLVRTQVNQGNSECEHAWLGVALGRSELAELAATRGRVLIARPEGLTGACVIVGVLRDRVQEAPDPPREVVLEARERLVVRCGAARIVLHSDGRYEVHAERISQRARGVHAIKGAAVRIN
jgi:hypothetical protein